MLLKPFSKNETFYRGNLHGHSKHSDGKLTSREVVEKYKSLGYDFTCLSDHLWEKTYFSSTTVNDTSNLNTKDFITLISAEIHCPGKKYSKDGLWHFVANGLPKKFKKSDQKESGPDLVKRAISAGAFVSIAHPEWYSLTSEEALSVSHAHAVEIYNHGSTIKSARGNGIFIADILLQEGKKINLTATDDSHFKVSDYGGGWVMVASKKLDEKSIIRALIDGNYYSSTGINIDKIWIDKSIIHIKSSPANYITISGKGYSSKTIEGNNITYAKFDLSTFNSEWFRITISNLNGKKAWSNPYFKFDLIT